MFHVELLAEERSHRKDGGGSLVAVMTCLMFLVFGLMFCQCFTVQVQIIRSGIDINERLKEPPDSKEMSNGRRTEAMSV